MNGDMAVAIATGEDATRVLFQARQLYAMRRRRDAAFGTRDLLGEPGWDILLDLFIGELEGTRIQVSSVCLDAGVPSTTILRWLARLEREELVYRAADNIDGRRRFVRLTDDGRGLMHEAIRSIGLQLPA